VGPLFYCPNKKPGGTQSTGFDVFRLGARRLLVIFDVFTGTVAVLRRCSIFFHFAFFTGATGEQSDGNKREEEGFHSFVVVLEVWFWGKLQIIF
jgi:hypothetical protein